VVDEGKRGVGSRDEGKHTGRNDLLFVEKMMWTFDGHVLFMALSVAANVAAT